jgi:bla regulator protein BlaR1
LCRKTREQKKVCIMSHQSLGKFSFGRKLMLAAIGVTAAAGLPGVGPLNRRQMFAQSPPSIAVPLPAFEVASIRVNHSGDLRVAVLFQSGRFVARTATVNLIVAVAYNVHPYQISGGPSWVSSERYDIQAKEPDEVAEELRKLPPERGRERQSLLLRSLLAERFKLKVSRRSEELPVYALVVAKSGPKLQPTPPDEKGPDIRMGPGQLTCRGLGMPTLATVLSNQLSRTVLDQTGLKGNFDFTVEWSRDQTLSGMSRQTAPGVAGPDAAPLDSSGPSFFTAVQEQLGLKLEPTKGPVEVIVIDHIERPSEN